MLRIVVFLAGFALALFALIDVIRTEDDRVKHLPKLVWLLLVLLFPLVGSIAWLVVGRDRDLSAGIVTGLGIAPDRSAQAALPMDPETDEEFQRRFRERVEQQRRAAREARLAEERGDDMRGTAEESDEDGAQT